MKTIMAVSISLLMFIASTSIFAGCYEAGRFVSCGDCQEGSPYVTQCQCADPEVIRHNPCMTTAKFCQAFGNVGAR